MTASQPFLQFQPLNRWNGITLLYFGLMSILIAGLLFLLRGSSYGRDILLGYVVGTQLFVYFLSLRNLTVYLIWLLIGAVHLFFYFILKNNPAYQFANGHAATGLRGTIPLLLLIPMLRYISLRIQKRELFTLSDYYTDLSETRKISFTDCLLFFIYLNAMLLLSGFVR